MKFATPIVGAAAVLAMAVTFSWAQPQLDGPAGRGRPQDGGSNPLARLLDTNRDGILSEDEIAAASAELKELDASKDGRLTQDELRAMMPAMGPRGGFGPGGPGRGPGGGGVAVSDFGGPPLPKDDVEQKILTTLEEMRRGPRYANVSPTDGRLLRLLAEAVGAKRIVEIGTSTGESGVWFALALRTTDGHLYTHEIDEGRAKVAEENFKKAGVADRITLLLGDAHETVKQHKEPIDILFLDADKQGYIDYLNNLMPLIRPGGLIIAHNMNPRQADPQYLEAITKSPDLETSFLFMDGGGVGVTLKKR